MPRFNEKSYRLRKSGCKSLVFFLAPLIAWTMLDFSRSKQLSLQDDPLTLTEIKEVGHAHGLNGHEKIDIKWQCECNLRFSEMDSVDKQIESNSYAVVDEYQKSEEGLKALSNRLGIDFQLADPKGFREWVRPGPLQSFGGPLPYREIGFDPVCSKEDSFVSNNSWFRDNLKSTECNTMPRERALAFVLANLLPQSSQAAKIMESSPNPIGISKMLRELYGPKRYTGSQFSPSVPCGGNLKGMNGDISLDLENQHCIPDESFDIVVSQDVFEHIYDPAKAFEEIARTLTPGGFHIFTVPLTSKQFGTFVFAERVDNAPPSPHGMTVKLHAPPEIHGNPMSNGGSLVTRQWGYDIIEFIRQSSGMETTVVYVDSVEFGIHDAEYREVLISRKAGRNDAFPTLWRTLENMKCVSQMFTCTTSTETSRGF